MASWSCRSKPGQYYRFAVLLTAAILLGAGGSLAQTGAADSTGPDFAYVTAGTGGKLFGKPPLYIAKIDDVPTDSRQSDWLGRVPSQDYTLTAGMHSVTLGFNLYGIIRQPLPIQRTVAINLLANTHYRFDSSWPWRNILFETLDGNGKIVATTELSKNETFLGQPGFPEGGSSNQPSDVPTLSANTVIQPSMTYDRWLSEHPQNNPDQ
jgi:hypothetical protein